jgi:hypothetical protein
VKISQSVVVVSSTIAGLLCGCGSQVIPGVVVEGTTATIAIPNDFDVGYGRRWAGTTDATGPPVDFSNPLEDLQRGEVIFRLYDSGTPVTNGKLAVRYITRVMRDASSVNSYNTGDNTQPVAFLDIPCGLVNDGLDKVYQIKVQRFRRNPANGFQFDPVQQSFFGANAANDWWGWGSTPWTQQQMIPIRVMDSLNDTNGQQPDSSCNRFTPIEAWGPFGTRGDPSGSVTTGIDTQYALDSSIPLPEFRVRLASSGTTAPYAWDLQLSYPAGRMNVFDVRLLRENPSGAIAIWKTTPSTTPPPSQCASAPGTIDLHVIDPQNLASYRVRGVAITYWLINQTSSCRRITESDVSIATESYRGYDANGNLLSGTNPFQVVPYDLQ